MNKEQHLNPYRNSHTFNKNNVLLFTVALGGRNPTIAMH